MSEVLNNIYKIIGLLIILAATLWVFKGIFQDEPSVSPLNCDDVVYIEVWKDSIVYRDTGSIKEVEVPIKEENISIATAEEIEERTGQAHVLFVDVDSMSQVDTTATNNEFFAVKTYKDTIREKATRVILDVMYRGELIDFDVGIQEFPKVVVKRETQVLYKTIEAPPRNRWGVGGSASVINNPQNGLTVNQAAAGIMFQHKSNNQFQLAYAISPTQNGISQGVQVGYYRLL